VKAISSPNSGLATGVLWLCSVLLISCSASYKATKVEPSEVTTAKPGIYYTLPMSELLVVASVKKTTKLSGIYAGDVWNQCKKACFDSSTYPEAECPADPRTPQINYELTKVKSFSRVVADPKHLYHVDVDLKAFAAFNHTFKLSNDGILTSSTSEIENKSVEIGINTAAALLKIAPLARTESAPGKMTNAAKLAACAQFKQDYARQEELDNTIVEFTNKLDTVLFSSSTPDGPAIEQLVKRHEARVSELKASNKYEKLMEHRAEVSRDEVLGDYAVRIVPFEFATACATDEDWRPVQQFDKEGFSNLEVTPAKEANVEAVLKELRKIRLTVSVKPQFGFDATNADGGHTTGYRYRFPSAGQVTVSRVFDYIDHDGNPQSSIEPIAAFRTLVAQYGAVTALPSKISGVKSKIGLDLYESTGSPRQVDVGATPLPSTTFADQLAPLQSELERRKAEKEEKMKELENEEMDALTKERDLLKLKKEIADLENALEPAQAH